MWTLFRRVKRLGYPESDLLSVYRDYGVIAKESRLGNFNKPSEDLSSYQLVRPRDLVVNKMKAWQGSVAISQLHGIVSPAYFVYEASHQEDDRYLHYLFRSAEYTDSYALLSKGIRPNQWDLDPDKHRTLKIRLPGVREQRQIADYLDRETGRIDALIAKQQQLIGTLAERVRSVRSMVLSSATTGVSLGLFADVQNGYAFKSEGFTTSPDATRLLRGVNVNPGRITWEEEVRWSREAGDGLGPFALREGDIVVGMDRPLVAEGIRVAQVAPKDLPALLLQRVARVSPRRGLMNAYLHLALSSQRFEDHLRPIFTGVSVPHISPDQIKQFRIPIPNLGVQQAAVSKVDREVLKITHVQLAAANAITLLRERRQALISAAVTGKIDVRGL